MFPEVVKEQGTQLLLYDYFVIRLDISAKYESIVLDIMVVCKGVHFEITVCFVFISGEVATDNNMYKLRI